MTTVIIILITTVILAIVLYKPIKARKERDLRLYCFMKANRHEKALDLYDFLSKKGDRKLRKKLTKICLDGGKNYAELVLHYINHGRYPPLPDPEDTAGNKT